MKPIKDHQSLSGQPFAGSIILMNKPIRPRFEVDLTLGKLNQSHFPNTKGRNCMGEWTEYFEDFPEENPANYVSGRFDPAGAKALQQQKVKVADEQANLNREIAEIVRKARLAKTAK